ncbi:peptidylprolyl isomerase [Methanofollis formosanus]|uniref:Peptidyl-prolyl cis-trans isomerase n=1 Tax=Methanofollis formosanus TaxID=299308 RepID=A0A8G1A4F4_9EURY|nr:peptidylprolyl isomerase [Methanofollis formosanus]QYZ80229.1 peptidylprolyl isomerase [Methanofollis formosanus]
MNSLVGLVAVAVLVIAAGCVGAAPKPTTGDTVSVEYTGTFDNGTVFDTNVGKEPFSFTIGNSEVIPGFEKAVLELAEGESVTVTIPAADAYGEYDAARMKYVDRATFPENITIGQMFLMKNGENWARFTVTAMNETTIIMDGNHALAGEDLTFTITLLSIQTHGNA